MRAATAISRTFDHCAPPSVCLFLRRRTRATCLLQDAAFAYRFAPSGVHVTYKPVGSTAGKDSIKANTVSFAGSDSLLKPEDYSSVPDLQMFPAVAASVVPIYNLPTLGSNSLVLNRATLPLIFLGDIRRWDDPRIAALQDDGVHLPAVNIS